MKAVILALAVAIAAFCQPPARSSPGWLKSGVLYQIFTRSFSQQGTFDGIAGRLDQLQSLGVNILWLMPIHPPGQVKKKGSLGSSYAVRDYYAIDPALGTKDGFRRLVQDVHRHGMKIILDMVANHTAWDSVMMSHPAFYKKDKQGQITFPYDWSDVAALDYSNPALRRYMTDALLYWVKDFDIDGYRCDAAGEVPTDFWESARDELERAKPGIMLLAEASKPELLRKAFDIDYSWPLLSTLNRVVMEGESATSVQATIQQQSALFPKGALHMRISDDHDELRAVTRYGYAGALAVSALIETLDGVPLIYNGMEVGDSTQTRDPALFEPQKIFWDAAKWRPDGPKFYAALNALRHAHPALQSQGELTWLPNSDEDRVVSYLRSSGNEEFLVIVNLSNKAFHGTVGDGPGDWKEVGLALPHTGRISLPFVALDAFDFRVYQRSK